MVARLKPGATDERRHIGDGRRRKQLEQQYPNENAGYGIFVNSLVNHRSGQHRDATLMLLGAVGFVLLIACGMRPG
jgi:hypothetical protein